MYWVPTECTLPSYVHMDNSGQLSVQNIALFTKMQSGFNCSSYQCKISRIYIFFEEIPIQIIYFCLYWYYQELLCCRVLQQL